MYYLREKTTQYKLRTTLSALKSPNSSIFKIKPSSLLISKLLSSVSKLASILKISKLYSKILYIL